MNQSPHARPDDSRSAAVQHLGPRLNPSRRPGRIATALIVVALTLGLTPLVRAGNVDNTGPYAMLTGQLQGRGEGEALFLWEHASQKLLVYLVTGNRMELLFVRDCSFDFKANVAIGNMKPTVGEMEKTAEAARGAGKVAPASAAVSPVAQPGYTLTLGRLPGGTGDLLYIFGHREKRLGVYSIRGGKLELMFLRDSENDFVPRALGKNQPTPAEMKEKVRSRPVPAGGTNAGPGQGAPKDDGKKDSKPESKPAKETTPKEGGNSVPASRVEPQVEVSTATLEWF